MKLRVAKKILKAPDAYNHQQRYRAAHRLYRQASTFKDGELAFIALLLKPQTSFVRDEELDLRFELFQLQIERGEQPTLRSGMVPVPPIERKPVYRGDGQVHNFNAMPYPKKVVMYGVEQPDMDKGWHEMGEWRYERPYTAKKYQIRTGGLDRGKKPKRLKLADIGMSDLTIKVGSAF